MKKVLSVLLLAALVCGTVLCTVGCGSGKQQLIFYNWEDYIDPEVLRMFEREYDCQVVEKLFTLCEDAYTKIKNGSRYDVVTPSDYMIERMIAEGMLAEIDVSAMPNYKYIGDDFKGLDYDKDNKYSVPFMWGTVGILYNTEKVTEPVTSWNILWDEKYAGQIIMQNSIRDCIAVATCKNGFDINTRVESELQKAKQDLIDQKPLVFAYYVDETKDQMANNAAALSVVWSGDAAYAIAKNDKLAYALPEEGTNYWFDAMVIPKNAPNYDLAVKFIDFMCRPEIAKMNLEYIYYSTPNVGAIELLDEEYTSDETIFPDMEYIRTKCAVFRDLGEYRGLYQDIWDEIRATN